MADYYDRDWERGRRWREGGPGGEREWGGRRAEDRGFLERAGDEVRSWFGDEEASRRRTRDEREYGGERGWGERGGPRERWGEERRGREDDWSRSWGYTEGERGRGGERAAGSAGAERWGGERGWGVPRGGERYAERGQGGFGESAGYGGRGGYGEYYGAAAYGAGAWRSPERYGGQGQGGWGHGGSTQEREGWEAGRGAMGWSRRRRGQFAGRGPRGYQRSDERIHEDVCERMAQDPDLDAGDIEVRVSNAEVTLTGSVQEREDKRRAEDIAEDVFGVKEVHNQIRVSHGLHEQQPGQPGATGEQRRAA